MKIEKQIIQFDSDIILLLRRYFPYIARAALFIIYFWFGILKLFNVSPANPLVNDLLQRTLPFISFHQFIILFSLFEMSIGVFFLVPRLERLALLLLAIHMVMTILPLFVLPQLTWQGFLAPTLEGQYIIKNVLIVALAIGIGAYAEPWQDKAM